jgi:hypothetical protein
VENKTTWERAMHILRMPVFGFPPGNFWKLPASYIFGSRNHQNGQHILYLSTSINMRGSFGAMQPELYCTPLLLHFASTNSSLSLFLSHLFNIKISVQKIMDIQEINCILMMRGFLSPPMRTRK